MSEERDTLSLTDEEDDDFEEEQPISELKGVLSKWTNYIHGWQDRYIVLKEGTLSYYKSENDTAFGCRGAVSLLKAAITPHQFDECRFDIGVNDCVWYLRASTAEDRQLWIEALDLQKQAESGYGSENSLRRHGSMLSITSGTSLSTTSQSSFKRGRGLREKLAEMETFRDILCRQIDTLQGYFDACSEAMVAAGVEELDTEDIDDVDDYDTPRAPVTNKRLSDRIEKSATHKDADRDLAAIFQQHGAHNIDFKGEALTFKATTAGIIATLTYSIELMAQREEAWKKRVEKEIEKRKKLEEGYKSLLADSKTPQRVLGGPDFEEGPHCAINEDEFFDAVDATLDKLEKEEEMKYERTLTKVNTTPKTSLNPKHRLYNEINTVIDEHIKRAGRMQGEGGECWELIHEEGEMKVYKMEIEQEGMVVDPMKAIHTVTGITGHELCHHFWNVDVRLDWEGTLETTDVLEWVSEDTVISYQTHKRVWPTTQRESLFWSHIRHVPNEDEDGPDLWICCNYSTDHEKAPPNNKCVRLRMNVAILCETTVEPPADGGEIKRDNIRCKITYIANVNPGGWAPASVLRAVYKREYPKFLKRFTQYVTDATKDKPIMF